MNTVMSQDPDFAASYTFMYIHPCTLASQGYSDYKRAGEMGGWQS